MEMSEIIMTASEQKEMLSDFIKELEKRSNKMSKIVQVFKTFQEDHTNDSAIKIHQLTTEIIALNGEQTDIYFGGYRVENMGLLKDINAVLAILATDYDLHLRDQHYPGAEIKSEPEGVSPVNLATTTHETLV
jgi:hypothetical protein